MPRKKRQDKNLALTFDPASPPSAEGQALLDALRSNLSLLGEIAMRYEVNNMPERPEDPHSISTPGDIHRLLGPEMSALAQEQLRVLLLDTHNKVIGQRVVYQGNVSSSIVRAAEVFRPAVVEAVPSIAIAHNHPSGSADPSPEDVHITRKLKQAADLLDIEMVDHVVIGKGRFVSLKERGLIPAFITTGAKRGRHDRQRHSERAHQVEGAGGRVRRSGPVRGPDRQGPGPLRLRRLRRAGGRKRGPREDVPGDLGHRMDAGGRHVGGGEAGSRGAALPRRRLPHERLRAPGRPSLGASVLAQPHRPLSGLSRRGIVPAHLLTTARQGGAPMLATHTIDPEGLFTISAGGFSATADAFARDENTEGLWFVSMVGSQTALKAIWASLLKQPPDTAHLIRGADGMALHGGYQRCIIPYETIGTWTTKIARLPATGGWHALVYTKTAEFAYEKDSFLLLAQSAAEAPALHHRFLDKRSPLPLHDSWAGWLWERGIEEGEIVPMQSVGVSAYRCSPKAKKLREDLSYAVASGRLTLPREEATAAGGETS